LLTDWNLSGGKEVDKVLSGLIIDGVIDPVW
jgi:hypothetical protein